VLKYSLNVPFGFVMCPLAFGGGKIHLTARRIQRRKENFRKGIMCYIIKNETRTHNLGVRGKDTTPLPFAANKFY